LLLKQERPRLEKSADQIRETEHRLQNEQPKVTDNQQDKQDPSNQIHNISPWYQFIKNRFSEQKPITLYTLCHPHPHPHPVSARKPPKKEKKRHPLEPQGPQRQNNEPK
jgi:hypothetical protein